MVFVEVEMDDLSLKELVEFMAKSLVDEPEQVEVNEVVGEHTTVFALKVAKSDLGKVIGKQGKTARSMRTILSAASTKLPAAARAMVSELISSTNELTEVKGMSKTSLGPRPWTLRWRSSRYVEMRPPKSRQSEARNTHIPSLSLEMPVADVMW